METLTRMQLSPSQRAAVIHRDDHGVADPAPIFTIDFDLWVQFQPHNFFNYFMDPQTIAGYAQLKPCWQRYKLLHPTEAKILQGIVQKLDGNIDAILKTPTVATRYYACYQELTQLVDELDRLVDRDLKPDGKWNHGYVLNEMLIV